MRILIILKSRPQTNYSYFSSGLYWSAKFVANMLVDLGVDTKLVEVIDNNDIDREVFNFKPDIVIIEALWVVPEKFKVLKKLHPSVKWVVRLHSNIPFLAGEGIAINWIREYVREAVQIGINSEKAYDDVWSSLGNYASDDAISYLPNYYPLEPESKINWPSGQILRIGCYGAIRPLKNQLLQAIAAIRYADEHNKILYFYINASRVESNGEPVLKNLKSLFDNTRHVLIQDHWLNHDDFLARLRSLDLGMQVSLSETFCITAADMVSVGLPLVASPEVFWASKFCKVEPTDGPAITRAIRKALSLKSFNVGVNRYELNSFNNKAKNDWKIFLDI